MTAPRAPRPPRLAAGRARALGQPTRGTTAPNRLRRVDRWLVGVHRRLLQAGEAPLVVDLGFGASPVTTVELHQRLRRLRSDVEVIGLEIDPERVAAARPAEQPGLRFQVGGFELAGLRATAVRAFNVLRQYDEATAAVATRTMTAGLGPGGVLVEGTCDELGRRAAWVLLDASGPRTLTLAAQVGSLERPSQLAERLPKCLIHHNIAGEPVRAFFAELDRAWASSAAVGVFGPRQRWQAMCETVDWPQLTAGRARYGEVTVPWDTVAPRGG